MTPERTPQLARRLSPLTSSSPRPTARFSLASGFLISADPSFLAIADLPEAQLASAVTWESLFGGHTCRYYHEDTRVAVKSSIKLIEQLVSRLRGPSATQQQQQVHVLLITRLGRLQVRSPLEQQLDHVLLSKSAL